MRENLFVSLITIVLLLFMTINLFILDLKVFSPQGNIKLSDVSTSLPTTTPSLFLTNNLQPTTDNLSCPTSCLSLIQQATEGGKTAIGSTPQDSISNTTVNIPAISQPKEYYIPLGSGSTQKTTWDDVTATETVVDFSSYGKIKEAYFVASLRNPTLNGQVEAQLYNVTDKHPVWGSPVVMNGPSSQTITSGKLSIDLGNKLYRVQLKSTLGAQAFLDNAKIRITTE